MASNSPAQPDTLSYLPEQRIKGGAPVFYEILQKSLKYPKSALKERIIGTAIVSFELLPSGEVSNIQLVNSLEENIDEEIIRSVNRTKRIWLADTDEEKIYIFYLPINYIYNDVTYYQSVHDPGFLLEKINVFTYGDEKTQLSDRNFYFERAITRFHEEEYQKAIRHLNELIRRDPFNQDLYKMRAHSRYKLGDLQGACEDYQRIPVLLHQPMPDAAKELCQ